MSVDRTRYDFNGKIGLTKKALIFEVVEKYISDSNKNRTLDELKKIFSEKSDFHIDMFVKETMYQNFNSDRRKRYFEDSFELNNGEKIYLSTQWGGDIFKQLLEKIQKAGHTVKDKEGMIQFFAELTPDEYDRLIEMFTHNEIPGLKDEAKQKLLIVFRKLREKLS